MHDPLAASATAGQRTEELAALLYQEHATAILAYLRVRVASAEEAEDLLLDVFLAALEQLEMLQQRSADVQRAWLRGVAAHKVADHYRYSDARQRTPLDNLISTLYADDTRSPERMALREEEAELLRTFLQRLPKLQQQVITLRFVYGLNSREIAQTLGKREGAARKLLWRALNRVRALYLDEPSTA
jgi:RNA polymerase sigma-70 factor (ECF subfamily)